MSTKWSFQKQNDDFKRIVHEVGKKEKTSWQFFIFSIFGGGCWSIYEVAHMAGSLRSINPAIAVTTRRINLHLSILESSCCLFLYTFCIQKVLSCKLLRPKHGTQLHIKNDIPKSNIKHWDQNSIFVLFSQQNNVFCFVNYWFLADFLV